VSANSANEAQVPSVRVALCQVYTEAWDSAGNFRRLMEGLEEAARQGAELAITPECVLHGYGFADREELRLRTLEAAEPLDGPRIAAVRDLARRTGMDIVFGFAERGPEAEGQDGPRLHNSAAFISREGALLWVYRKVHCRDFESAEYAGAFTPGDRFYVSPRRYDAGEFPIGAYICFDREVAEATRCLRALGVQFIACPLATSTFPMDQPPARADNEIITRVRAAENEVCIAVINHAGRFNGGSFVVGPMGELICRLGEEAEVRTVEVPVGAAARLQAHARGWMGWGFRRPEVYALYLNA